MAVEGGRWYIGQHLPYLLHREPALADERLKNPDSHRVHQELEFARVCVRRYLSSRWLSISIMITLR
jgi:hypothetical protein